ncbi:SPARC-like protein 1 [Engraulis encrasicolus]|uniref:SPARC-like protein 1 n=1 Tax=Engraulis encrasicolus TaxID=184585 RepID=UPI002FD66AA6
MVTVKGKPHAKHNMLKYSQLAKEKEFNPEEPNEGLGSILPTFLPFEASSQEQEQEEGDREVVVVGFGEEIKDSSTPVLLSEEALADLLQGSDEEDVEEQEEQEAVPEEQARQEGKEAAEASDADSEEEVKRNEEEKDEEQAVDKDEADSQEDAEKKPEELKAEEDSDSSTESEIPVDLDYASDSDGSEPELEEAKEVSKEEQQEEEEIPTVMADYDPETGEFSEKKEEEHDNDKAKDGDVTPHKVHNGDSKDGDSDSSDVLQVRLTGDEDNKEEKQTNDSGSSSTKGKGRKQRKNQHKRKGEMQGDQPFPGQPTNSGHRQMLDQQKTPTESTDNNAQKAKRRRSGKWAPMIGMNPVQIRATVELYPSLRPHPALPGQAAETNPCENIRCKRGKVCKVGQDNKPVCVCQEASDCPTSVTEFDHVCGTDNKTYDTSCQLFSTKCHLEGTKKGHKLHLDYTGACKFIPPCLGTELAQFPLRMRDWLKNVLLQLYEHDTMAPGFLTPKQRARVQKIYESERRLHAGDHPIDLLAQDFEKNYQMYIYPVHWQFAQMDQHPADRFLSHSELAPLRVPLVPMEHCTSDFFQQCDADKDKQVSFKEWGHCFGIKEDDMDPHLLF